MIIKGLEFIETCDSCPEQYNVYDKNNNIVGYVRLRWGNLICRCPNANGDTIYSVAIGDALTGIFEDNLQRICHLTAIADKLNEQLSNLCG